MRFEKQTLLDFINQNKAEIRSLQPPHLTLCLSSFYTCCATQTREFRFFNWLCLSGLPQLIFYCTWPSLMVAFCLISPFLKKTLAAVPGDIHQNLFTCFCHILGHYPQFIGLFKFTNTLFIFLFF